MCRAGYRRGPVRDRLPPNHSFVRASRVFAFRSYASHHGPQDFLDGRYAPGGFQEAVVPESHHTLTLSEARYLAGRGPPQNHVLDSVGDHHELVDADPSPVSAPTAPIAADRLLKARFSVNGEREREAHPPQDLLLYLNWLAAPLAQPPRQPLGDHAVDGRGRQERLDAHVNQPGDRGRRVVGVQRG